MYNVHCTCTYMCTQINHLNVDLNLKKIQVLKREEAVAKGINFDRIVAELVMKMNRMQVGKSSTEMDRFHHIY